MGKLAFPEGNLGSTTLQIGLVAIQLVLLPLQFFEFFKIFFNFLNFFLLSLLRNCSVGLSWEIVHQ